MDYYDRNGYLSQPKTDRKSVKFALVGCAFFFFIGAVATLFILKHYQVLGGPSKVVQYQLQAVQEGNFHLAYTYFTHKYKKRTSLEEFRNSLDPFAPQLPYRTSHLDHVLIQENHAEVGGTLIGRDGSVFPVFYELVKEEGDWKITAYAWEQPGEQQQI